mgnify:CR=1 FL=1
MHISKNTMLDLLDHSDLTLGIQKFSSLEIDNSDFLNSEQMAHFFVNSALLVSILSFVKEQAWLQDKEDKKQNSSTSYEELIDNLFSTEIELMNFVRKYIIKTGRNNIGKLSSKTKLLETMIISLVKDRTPKEKKKFVIQSLKEMSKHFIFEEKLQNGRLQHLGHRGPRLYRTFDKLDEIFEIDYGLDQSRNIKNDNNERLYEGAGVGVQSGYSTILLSLINSSPSHGSRIVDLGSGYGRVGLVCSLLRPDIEFVGFEYVPHRVEVSNIACHDLDLADNLSFKTQDLSLSTFKIPEADIYYLYDPFTKETYQYVLKQIVEVSKSRDVTIITKGNARSWLLDISKAHGWQSPIFIDEGNLCIFKSSKE